MDLHHLRVFQAAARASTFTAAGRELSLSQSTVSLHIKQLEDDFGCLFFLRSRKRVVLTDAGRVFLQYVDRIFAEYKNAELAVGEFAKSKRGTIRLGVGATTLIYLLPKVLADYRRKYPLIEILVTTGTTEILLQSLLDHQIDLAVVMSPSEALESVDSVPLLTEALVIVLAAKHPLSGKKVLLPRDLEDLAVISPLRGTAMETVQREVFDRLGVQPRIAMEMENMEAIKSLVRAGLGVALLPLCCVVGLAGRGLVHKHIHGMSMSRELLLAVTDWRAHPPATRRLAERILRALGTSETVASERTIDFFNEND